MVCYKRNIWWSFEAIWKRTATNKECQVIGSTICKSNSYSRTEKTFPWRKTVRDILWSHFNEEILSNAERTDYIGSSLTSSMWFGPVTSLCRHTYLNHAPSCHLSCWSRLVQSLAGRTQTHYLMSGKTDSCVICDLTILEWSFEIARIQLLCAVNLSNPTILLSQLYCFHLIPSAAEAF